MDTSFSPAPERGWVVEPVYTSDRRVMDVLAQMMASEQSIGCSDVGTQNIMYTQVVNLRPRRIVEIGGGVGGCSLVIGAALRLNGYGKLLAIEPDTYTQNMARMNIEKAGLSDLVEVIPGFSHDEPCKARLAAEGPFELAFIDASHDYDAALHDIELCASLLHDNGFMVLHDTGTAGPGMDSTGRGGVRRALYDFAERHLEMKTIYYEYPLWPNPCGAAIVCKQRYHPVMVR